MQGFQFGRSIITRLDGSLGIELSGFEGLNKVSGRSALAAYFSCLLKPKGEESRVAVLFGQLFKPNPGDYRLPSWPGYLGNYVMFAQAAIADFLDAGNELPFTPSGVQAAEVKCFSGQLAAWKDREAEDDTIEVFLEGRCWWAWKYGHQTAFFGPSECLQLGASVQDITRVADLRNGELWAVETRHPSALVLRPTSLLLQSRRNAGTRGAVDVPAPAKVFIEQTRIDALRGKAPGAYDLKRLIELCEELNKCWRTASYLAIAALTRALLDHVPPLFGASTFAEVANSYAGAKSFKESMAHLEKSARKIGDAHLHQRIRPSEDLPTSNQVDFSRELDVLLGEIIRIM